MWAAASFAEELHRTDLLDRRPLGMTQFLQAPFWHGSTEKIPPATSSDRMHYRNVPYA
jgi:hypothetical protein